MGKFKNKIKQTLALFLNMLAVALLVILLPQALLSVEAQENQTEKSYQIDLNADLTEKYTLYRVTIPENDTDPVTLEDQNQITTSFSIKNGESLAIVAVPKEGNKKLLAKMGYRKAGAVGPFSGDYFKIVLKQVQFPDSSVKEWNVFTLDTSREFDDHFTLGVGRQESNPEFYNYLTLKSTNSYGEIEVTPDNTGRSYHLTRTINLNTPNDSLTIEIKPLDSLHKITKLELKNENNEVINDKFSYDAVTGKYTITFGDAKPNKKLTLEVTAETDMQAVKDKTYFIFQNDAQHQTYEVNVDQTGETPIGVTKVEGEAATYQVAKGTVYVTFTVRPTGAYDPYVVINGNEYKATKDYLSSKGHNFDFRIPAGIFNEAATEQEARGTVYIKEKPNPTYVHVAYNPNLLEISAFQEGEEMAKSYNGDDLVFKIQDAGKEATIQVTPKPGYQLVKHVSNIRADIFVGDGKTEWQDKSKIEAVLDATAGSITLPAADYYAFIYRSNIEITVEEAYQTVLKGPGEDLGSIESLNAVDGVYHVESNANYITYATKPSSADPVKLSKVVVMEKTAENGNVAASTATRVEGSENWKIEVNPEDVDKTLTVTLYEDVIASDATRKLGEREIGSYLIKVARSKENNTNNEESTNTGDNTDNDNNTNHGDNTHKGDSTNNEGNTNKGDSTNNEGNTNNGDNTNNEGNINNGDNTNSEGNINNGDGTNHEENSNMIEPDQEKDKNKDKDKEAAPIHEHSYTWTIVTEASVSGDGLEILQCSCGDILAESVIPASQVYVNKLRDSINNAPANGTVTYDSDRNHTFSDYIIKRLAERTDVTIVIDFKYKNVDYTMTIPAGVDYSAILADEEEFYGYFYFALLTGATIVEK